MAGESNSGKTETSRLIVHFLTQVSEARRAAAATGATNSSQSSLIGKYQLTKQRSSNNVPTTMIFASSKRPISPNLRKQLTPKHTSSISASNRLSSCSGFQNTIRGSLLKQRSVESDRVNKVYAHIYKTIIKHNTFFFVSVLEMFP